MHSTGDGNAKIPRPTQIAMLKFCAQRAAQRLPQDAPERRTGARKKRPLERARARNQGVVVVVVGLSDSEKAFIGPMGNGLIDPRRTPSRVDPKSFPMQLAGFIACRTRALTRAMRPRRAAGLCR